MASCSASLSHIVVLFLSVAAVLSPALAQEDEHLVVDLPGQPPVGFRHYAGYVKPRPDGDKALFYWFFEADSGAPRKPLVLWLNGGPGCSSIAYGAAQELGPFLVRSSTANLTLNRYSWNKVANLLFLETPVGVGFSYTNRSSELRHLGDRITAQDSYAFLLNWFERFPRFKGHDFYITGESYAGHYVPQLAELIYEGNKGASKDAYINFKGFMIGNAVLNEGTDQVGMVEYAWSHAIISDGLYHAIRKNCSDFRPTISGNPASCSSAVKAFLQAYEDIDIYSIYTPVCLASLASHPPATATATATATAKPKRPSSPIFLFSHPELWNGDDGRLRRMARAGYDPCTEDYVEKYFNRADVQKALHANTSGLPYAYSACSEVIEKWNDSPATVLPIIQKLIKAGLRIWVYSGDTDGRVPVTSTRYSLNQMGLKTEKEWKAWYHRKQVAGWVVEYEMGLTFATLRGAGHQVPVFAPDRSLSLLNHFLGGKPLPPSRI